MPAARAMPRARRGWAAGGSAPLSAAVRHAGTQARWEQCSYMALRVGHWKVPPNSSTASGTSMPAIAEMSTP